MNPLAQRKTIAAAYSWKQEKLSELEAQIEIQWALMASLMKEKKQLAALHGQDLSARFWAESKEDLERTMQGKSEFLEDIQALLVLQPYAQNKKRAA